MITGAEKAVLFLLSLDEQVARPIVGELSEADVRRLRAVASTMREVPASALDDAFREFLSRADAALAVPRGGLPYLRRLSAAAFGEETTKRVFDEGVTSPLERLESAEPESIASLLANEPPQLVAAILASLDPRAAGAVLATMPRERQAAVVRHVSRLTKVPARVLEDVASALANELPEEDAATLVTIDGVAKAAELLNSAGKDAAMQVLADMDELDKVVAGEVRMAMFTFEDLRRVAARDMRELLREVPTERLTLALKGASDELMTAIFAGLSARAADLIRDDLQLLGKIRKAELDAARREVLEVALRLESEGRVDLAREGIE